MYDYSQHLLPGLLLTHSPQCCPFWKLHPCPLGFCIRDGQTCSFCNMNAIHMLGLLYQKARWCCCGSFCVPKNPGKWKKKRSHCCCGSSPVGLPCPAMGQGTCRKPLHSPPWAPSVLSHIYLKLCGSGTICGARKKGYLYLSPRWAFSKAPLARTLTGKLGLSGCQLKAQESRLSLPMEGNRKFLFCYSFHFPSYLQWRRKERVPKKNDCLGLWSHF